LRFFLGIDISKEKFDACLIGTNGEKLFQMAASMDRAGFDELLGRLASVAGSRESILIGMESTACYHINLFSFLTSRGFSAIIINPLLICNFMKLQLRKTKTDMKDAVVIAQFLLLKKDSLSQNLLSPDSRPTGPCAAEGKPVGSDDVNQKRFQESSLDHLSRTGASYWDLHQIRAHFA